MKSKPASRKSGKKSKRGGRRPGAGRPAVLGVARAMSVQVLLSAAELERLDEARGDTPMGVYLRRLLETIGVVEEGTA